MLGEVVAARATATRRGEHDHHSIPLGDHGGRAAQVVRRPAGAGRHRPGGSRRARSSRCSAPTAPARPPRSRSCPPSSAPTAGEVRVAGHDVARDPDAVRAAIGVTGQFSAVDNLLTGEENLLLMADLHHLGRREGRRRAAELLERFDLAEAAEQAGRDLLRRHAAPARPGDDPGRRPADHLPRRADHRPRPAQPPHHVADHPRPGRRRGHDLPDHPVPGGGGPARRPDRAPRPRPAGRRGHLRPS